MKKFNYTKKLTLGVTTVSMLGLVGVSSVLAWGPERTTYTMESPAPRALFNSIENNPTIGDEREFVRIGTLKSDDSLDDLEALAGRTEMKSSVVIEPGKQYLVSIYYHNDAGSNRNTADEPASSEGPGCYHCGAATGVKVSTNFPKVLTPGAEGKASATIGWDWAWLKDDTKTHEEVWDDVTLTTATKKVLLHYVTDSAAIYNDVLHGTKLSSSMFEETGTLIGYDVLDGFIPGCEQYHGRIFYVIEAEELSGTVDKTVSKDGETFSESVEIDPEEEVTFKLEVKNTGDKELTNVVVKDTLPAGLTFVPGSAQLWANDSTTKETISDDIVSDGVNLGTLGTGNIVHITFRAKAGKEYECDGINMTNKAIITYDSDVATGDSDEDTAKVKIKKDECEPEPEEDCTTNPDLPGCKELPNTGPVEIAMAIAIALGIGGGGYYFYRTKKSLKTIEGTANGTTTGAAAGKETTPETPAQIQMEQPKEEKADK